MAGYFSRIAARIATLASPISPYVGVSTVGSCGWNPAKEASLVLESSNVLVARRGGDFSQEKAKDIVRRNRQQMAPVLYTGAAFQIEDFLATGTREGVFLDGREYEPESREVFLENIDSTFKRYGIDEYDYFEKRTSDGREGLVFRFVYCGENKEITCYLGYTEHLFNKLVLQELERGISHLISIHRPSFPTHVTSSILKNVVLGGHVEGKLGSDPYLLEELLGLKLLGRNFGSAWVDYNIYQKVRNIDFKQYDNTTFVYKASVVLEMIQHLQEGRPYRPAIPAGNVGGKYFVVETGQDPLEAELKHDFNDLAGEKGELFYLRKSFDDLSPEDQVTVVSYLGRKLSTLRGTMGTRIRDQLMLVFPELST